MENLEQSRFNLRHEESSFYNNCCFNVCCRGILLVLVALAVQDIRGNQDLMRMAGTPIWDRGGKRLWMTLMWNSNLGSSVNFCRKEIAVVYILFFLRPRPKMGSPLACRPDLT